jgi:hypothetical protein
MVFHGKSKPNRPEQYRQRRLHCTHTLAVDHQRRRYSANAGVRLYSPRQPAPHKLLNKVAPLIYQAEDSPAGPFLSVTASVKIPIPQL